MATVRPEPMKVVGFQQITSLAASTALTVPAGAKMALVSAEAQNIRIRSDGTAPTAAIGLRLIGLPGATAPPEASPVLLLQDPTALRFIEEVAGAKLNVEYLA